MKQWILTDIKILVEERLEDLLHLLQDGCGEVEWKAAMHVTASP
jgi:hypothetical protein